MGWLGRVGQAVKVRGMFVHPRQLAAALDGVDGLSRYQGVVTRAGHRDELTVSVEVEPGADIDADALREALEKAVKVRVSLAVVSAGAIPADAAVLEDRRVWE